MEETALEVLAIHDLNMANVSAQIYMCDNDEPRDGLRDDFLSTSAPALYSLCAAGDGSDGLMSRKLVYTEAVLISPLYFLQILGFENIPLKTYAIAEAAPIDLVIVIDTSESMGLDTTGYDGSDFDPAGCNASNTCQPLLDAKNAAIGLIDTLAGGYDQVAIVTFDQIALTHYNLGGELETAKTAVGNIHLHDDPPANKLWASWYDSGYAGRYNPANVEDRDGDGLDADPGLPCTLDEDRWDDTLGRPCDDDNLLDAFDWDGNGIFEQSDHDTSAAWQASHNPYGPSEPPPPMAVVSTCTGCGMREASNILVNFARPQAVWVIVFLSDGVANMSDTPGTYAYNASTGLGVPSTFPNGYCTGGINLPFWSSNCLDREIVQRVCADDDPDTCPPDTVLAGGGVAYSVEDYARDATDTAALLFSENEDEPSGNDIAIYSIGLGESLAMELYGEPLLRYMAAVGDDGDRETDPCATTAKYTKCGQYYFAPSGDHLMPIFEDIASRIYTKIAQ
jgi:hypothetical protein